MSQPGKFRLAHEEYLDRLMKKMDDSDLHFGFLEEVSKGYLKGVIDEFKRNRAMFEAIARTLRKGEFKRVALDNPKLLYKMLLLNLVIIRAPLIDCARTLFSSLTVGKLNVEEFFHFQPYATRASELAALKDLDRKKTDCCVFAIDIAPKTPLLAIPQSNLWVLPFQNDHRLLKLKAVNSQVVSCKPRSVQTEYTRYSLHLVPDKNIPGHRTMLDMISKIETGKPTEGEQGKLVLELKSKANVLDELEGLIDQTLVEVSCNGTYGVSELHERSSEGREKLLLFSDCNELPNLRTCGPIRRRLLFDESQKRFVYKAVFPEFQT